MILKHCRRCTGYICYKQNSTKNYQQMEGSDCPACICNNRFMADISRVLHGVPSPIQYIYNYIVNFGYFVQVKFLFELFRRGYHRQILGGRDILKNVHMLEFAWKHHKSKDHGILHRNFSNFFKKVVRNCFGGTKLKKI